MPVQRVHGYIFPTLNTLPFRMQLHSARSANARRKHQLFSPKKERTTRSAETVEIDHARRFRPRSDARLNRHSRQASASSARLTARLKERSRLTTRGRHVIVVALTTTAYKTQLTLLIIEASGD